MEEKRVKKEMVMKEIEKRIGNLEDLKREMINEVLSVENEGGVERFLKKWEMKIKAIKSVIELEKNLSNLIK